MIPRCPICQTMMTLGVEQWWTIYCGPRCKKRAELDADKVRRIARRSQERRECRRCGVEYVPRHGLALYCTAECQERARIEKAATDPDMLVRSRSRSRERSRRIYVPHPREVMVSCQVEGCDRPHLAKGMCRAHYYRPRRADDWDQRRALKQAKRIGPVRRLAVYERDGWVCQLCGDPVDRTLKGPDPMSKSLDHIVPLSWPEGTHTEDNVQLAHLRCNLRKGARSALSLIALQVGS